MDLPTTPDVGVAAPEFMVSAQSLPLPSGIYAFTVRGRAAAPETEGFAVPAVQIGLAPTIPQGSATFLTGPATCEHWLVRNGDVVVVRIDSEGATLLLTSLRPATSAPLTVDVRRLDATDMPSRPMSTAEAATAASTSPALVERVLHAEVLTHIRNHGDMVFFDGWAGFIGQQLSIEGFAIKPLEELTASMIEYKTVGMSGAESSWASDGTFCGARGAGLPLLGFAIRLKSGADEFYDCQYSGSFVSGEIVGPLGNGALCCSAIRDDPLDGIQLRIVDRRPLASPVASGVGILRS
jgi:hypothetical protein